jgi:hypothetical protein
LTCRKQLDFAAALRPRGADNHVLATVGPFGTFRRVWNPRPVLDRFATVTYGFLAPSCLDPFLRFPLMSHWIKRSNARSFYTSWPRFLVIPALLALLTTGCVDSNNEKAEGNANLNQEITRYTGEKGGKSGAGEISWSGPTWVVVEGNASQFAGAASAKSPWKLTSPTDSSKEVTVIESRTSTETPNTAWLLMSSSDASVIDSVSSAVPWRLITGTGGVLVQVRGYYVRNGTQFRSHLVVQSGVTGAGASIAANQGRVSSAGVRRPTAGSYNVGAPSFHSPGASPGSVRHSVSGRH